MACIIRALFWLPKYLSIGLIRFYQRYISPHKGFCCAYRQYSGGRSCSHFALVAIRRHGVSALWLSFPMRLDECKKAAIALTNEHPQKDKHHPCEYCEALEFCECFKGCDVSKALPCDCDCDFSIRSKSKKRNMFSFSPFFIFIWLYKRLRIKQRQ